MYLKEVLTISWKLSEDFNLISLEILVYDFTSPWPSQIHILTGKLPFFLVILPKTED